jgi:hypothetical protein
MQSRIIDLGTRCLSLSVRLVIVPQALTSRGMKLMVCNDSVESLGTSVRRADTTSRSGDDWRPFTSHSARDSSERGKSSSASILSKSRDRRWSSKGKDNLRMRDFHRLEDLLKIGSHEWEVNWEEDRSRNEESDKTKFTCNS